MELDGRRILITGSTRGIGRDMAERFIAEGARVAVNGRNAATVDDTVLALGDAAVAAAGELGSATACEAVVTAAAEALGGLDLVVNNAGYYDIASIDDTDELLWDRTMDSNVKATFFTSRAALGHLRAAGGGGIINHASIAGLIGLANVAAYCTSKGAIVHLTRAMAMELAPAIRVNCVCPTTVNNDMGWLGFNRADEPQAAYEAFVQASKMKRMATNEDVVEAFLFLASARSSFMTGVALPVDGGKSAGV